MSHPIKSDPEIVVDEATVYKALKIFRGDRGSTRVFLGKSGIGITAEQLDQTIKDSVILSAMFGSGSPIIHPQVIDPEAALLRLPDGNGEYKKMDDQDMGKIVAIQDEYIAARGMEGVGFSSEDITEMASMAQFVGHGFRKTVDLTHGVMVTGVWKLKKRLDKLEAMIDNEDEEVERIEFYSGKDSCSFETFKSKRTEAERLELIREYRALADLVHKYASATSQGAAIRLKAETAAWEAGQRNSRKPTKKLKQG